MPFTFYVNKDLKVCFLTPKCPRNCLKWWPYLFPPQAYRRKRSTSHTLLPLPPRWAPFLQTFCLHRAVRFEGPQGIVGGAERMHCGESAWKQGCACAWLSCVLGMRPDISRESKPFANSPAQKKRELGEGPASELPQHIPAWLTLAGGLCLSIRVGKQRVGTWPVLFLTLALFKLSFHGSGQRANGERPLNSLIFSHHQWVEWQADDSTFRPF